MEKIAEEMKRKGKKILMEEHNIIDDKKDEEILF